MNGKKGSKIKYRVVGIEENINPQLSITYLKGADTYNLFRESDGLDLGNHTRERLLSLGFTKNQLKQFEESGTVNLITEEDIKKADTMNEKKELKQKNRVWIVEYLDSLLGDSSIFLFDNPDDAQAEFDRWCAELQDFADDEQEQVEGEPNLFTKKSNEWWLSGEVSGISDLMVRLSFQDI